MTNKLEISTKSTCGMLNFVLHFMCFTMDGIRHNIIGEKVSTQSLGYFLKNMCSEIKLGLAGYLQTHVSPIILTCFQY